MRGVLKHEWFEIVDTMPPEVSFAWYWDTAYQKKKTSDYTVGVKYGVSRDGISYIVHIARMKGNPHEVETFIANVAAQDSRSIRIILQQEPGSGSALWIDSMHAEHYSAIRSSRTPSGAASSSVRSRFGPPQRPAMSNSCAGHGTMIFLMNASSSVPTSANTSMTTRSTQLAERST